MAEALSTSPLPADISEAIRTVKAQLRSQIGDVAAVFAEVETAMREEATVVAADRAAGRPGSNSAGLSPHTDSGSVERWLLPAYQQVFRHVYSGDWLMHDPWDGAFRTEVSEFPSTVMCSAFRTFQGWTALSDMQPDQGVLHTVPIPAAMAYILLRALQDDVAADDLCGAVNGQAVPITNRYYSVLLQALTPIPAVLPGDTVWWHADLIHSVRAVSGQQGL